MGRAYGRRYKEALKGNSVRPGRGCKNRGYDRRRVMRHAGIHYLGPWRDGQSTLGGDLKRIPNAGHYPGTYLGGHGNHPPV